MSCMQYFVIDKEYGLNNEMLSGDTYFQIDGILLYFITNNIRAKLCENSLVRYQKGLPPSQYI